MKHPKFLVDYEKVFFPDILHFLIHKMHRIRGSTRGQPTLFVSCPDNKQAEKNKIVTIKTTKTMRTIIASILLMMLGVVSWAQNATINGSYCSSAPACPMYVCQGSSTTITAGVTSGTIDSLKLRERYSDNGGSTWSTWSLIGTSTTTTVPSGGSAVSGRIYQYWLRVYQSGSERWAFAEMYVNAAPTATLVSNYTACCQGTNVTFNAAAGGTTYDFKVNGTTVQSSASSSYQTSTLVTGDVVTVTITNSGGCSATSAGITMTVWPTPQATTVTGNPIGCVGSNGTVTITGLTGTGPWNLEVWNTSGGVPSSLYYSAGSVGTTNTTINVPIPAVGLTNMYLRVTDSHGCSNQ